MSLRASQYNFVEPLSIFKGLDETGGFLVEWGFCDIIIVIGTIN